MTLPLRLRPRLVAGVHQHLPTLGVAAPVGRDPKDFGHVVETGLAEPQNAVDALATLRRDQIEGGQRRHGDAQAVDVRHQLRLEGLSGYLEAGRTLACRVTRDRHDGDGDLRPERESCSAGSGQHPVRHPFRGSPKADLRRCGVLPPTEHAGVQLPQHTFPSHALRRAPESWVPPSVEHAALDQDLLDLRAPRHATTVRQSRHFEPRRQGICGQRGALSGRQFRA